ncbi:hypothetical protein DP145_12990 [Clostridium tetani]|uniref:hypothetical protein n=1 Tax=Clostridium tetani TaxID=1513 RepID=UPI00100C30EF|nr:hypothetical protein [Clostridium tetani]RXI43998.1 hypothetical protein DP126_12355 [Clostridium tetani]RXM59551.1 hypothetical protein DP138_12630 [Clostridium tetani]RXM63714.1 hypothetical protein DP145_12990 [Clostridium tetani]
MKRRKIIMLISIVILIIAISFININKSKNKVVFQSKVIDHGIGYLNKDKFYNLISQSQPKFSEEIEDHITKIIKNHKSRKDTEKVNYKFASVYATYDIGANTKMEIVAPVIIYVKGDKPKEFLLLDDNLFYCSFKGDNSSNFNKFVKLVSLEENNSKIYLSIRGQLEIGLSNPSKYNLKNEEFKFSYKEGNMQYFNKIIDLHHEEILNLQHN